MSTSTPFTILPSSSSSPSSSTSSSTSSISYSSLLRESRGRRARKNDTENDGAINVSNEKVGNIFGGNNGEGNGNGGNGANGGRGEDVEMKETRLRVLEDEEIHRREQSRSTPNHEDGHDSSLLIPSNSASDDTSSALLATPGNSSPSLQTPFPTPFHPSNSSSSTLPSSNANSSSSTTAASIGETTERNWTFSRSMTRLFALCLIRVCSPFALLRIYPFFFVLLLLACSLLFVQSEFAAAISVLCFTIFLLGLYMLRLWIFWRWRDRPLNRAISSGDYHRVDQLFQEENGSTRRGRSWFTSNTAFRLAAVDRDFTANDYEMLLRLDEENGVHRRGMHQSQIERLPQFVLKKSLGNDESKQNSDEESNCSICLDAKKQGDTLRGLPCMHSFHRECVDKWLRRKNVCPTCRLPVNLDSRGSFFSPSNSSSSSASMTAGSELRSALGDLSMEEIEALQEAIAMEQSLRESTVADGRQTAAVSTTRI